MSTVKTSKIPAGVLGNVKKKCAVVVGQFDTITHVWGFGTEPDHNNKRCIDFMIKTINDGQEVANWVWKYRKELGVELIIWNRQIIRTYDKPGIPAGTWAPYYGPNPHRDHPHVQFNNNALTGVLVEKPKPTKPKPTTPVETVKKFIQLGDKIVPDIGTVAAKWVNREITAFSDSDSKTKVRPTREVLYVQAWLAKLGFYAGKLDGIWNVQSQSAYNAFRVKEMKLSGSDARGTITKESLGKLRTAARSGKKVA